MATVKDTRKTKACKQCATVSLARLFPEYRKGLCAACFRAKKQKAIEELIQRPCKTCGKPVGTKDKRQIVCSKECGHSGRSLGRASIQCAVCGKWVERYLRQVKKFKAVCCSLECQRKLALVDNHSAKNVDWIIKSKKAKKRWYDKRSKERRAKNAWLIKSLKERSRLCERRQGKWQQKCNAAAATLRSRKIGKGVKRQCSLLLLNWAEAIQKARAIHKQKLMRKNQTEWQRKVYSVAHNMRLRWQG